MRTATMEDIRMLIDDNVRMDIWMPYPSKVNSRDFEYGCYRKHACDDLERYISTCFSGYLELDVDYIKQVLVRYIKCAERYERYAGRNKMIFEHQIDVARTLLQVL